MRITAVSFKGYDKYPINGGKVEKLEYERTHGMCPSTDTYEASPTSNEPGATDCPGSISDLFPSGCYEHNPWFPLDD